MLNKLLIYNEEINKRLDFLIEVNKILKKEITELNCSKIISQPTENAPKTYDKVSKVKNTPNTGLNLTQFPEIKTTTPACINIPCTSSIVPKILDSVSADIINSAPIVIPSESESKTHKKKIKQKLTIMGTANPGSRIVGAVQRKWIYVGKIAGTEVNEQDIKEYLKDIEDHDQ